MRKAGLAVACIQGFPKYYIADAPGLLTAYFLLAKVLVYTSYAKKRPAAQQCPEWVIRTRLSLPLRCRQHWLMWEFMSPRPAFSALPVYVLSIFSPKPCTHFPLFATKASIVNKIKGKWQWRDVLSPQCYFLLFPIHFTFFNSEAYPRQVTKLGPGKENLFFFSLISSSTTFSQEDWSWAQHAMCKFFKSWLCSALSLPLWQKGHRNHKSTLYFKNEVFGRTCHKYIYTGVK